jgi:hypothetical protein
MNLTHDIDPTGGTPGRSGTPTGTGEELLTNPEVRRAFLGR